MNLKTRITKIEKAMMPTGGVCGCRDVRKTEIHFADLGEDSDTGEPWFEGTPVPGFCDKCRNPIEKKILILQLVDRTTKTRFPEEWNAAN